MSHVLHHSSKLDCRSRPEPHLLWGFVGLCQALKNKRCNSVTLRFKFSKHCDSMWLLASVFSDLIAGVFNRWCPHEAAVSSSRRDSHSELEGVTAGLNSQDIKTPNDCCGPGCISKGWDTKKPRIMLDKSRFLMNFGSVNVETHPYCELLKLWVAWNEGHIVPLSLPFRTTEFVSQRYSIRDTFSQNPYHSCKKTALRILMCSQESSTRII